MLGCRNKVCRAKVPESSFFDYTNNEYNNGEHAKTTILTSTKTYSGNLTTLNLKGI